MLIEISGTSTVMTERKKCLITSCKSKEIFYLHVGWSVAFIPLSNRFVPLA